MATTKPRVRSAPSPRPTSRPCPARRDEGCPADDEGPPHGARGEEAADGVARADREPAPRGPAPRAHPGSGGVRPLRSHGRPRPPQGHPRAVPAVADEPPAPRLPHRVHRPAGVRRRGVPRRRSAPRWSSTAATKPIEDDTWSALADRIVYHRGDFADPALFDGLAERARPDGREQGTRGNRLFYLATQPSAFSEIIAQLGRAGLDHERHDGGWRRVVIEKPFGRDLESAKRLNREIGKVFRERRSTASTTTSGKETVRNLLVFRFGNWIFEPLWNRRYVDHVQITVAESIGVEDRGAFYEETGASRDFLQNHLLQLLSLVAMEPPATFDADALRDEKVKVLRAAISELTPDQVRSDVVRGQYGPGWVPAQAGPRLPRRARGRPRIGDGDVRRGPPRRSTTGAGRACRSISGPASACPSAPRRSRSSSGTCRIACSATAARIPSPTCSRSGSSRTRGSCSGSGPRSRAWASTCAT